MKLTLSQVIEALSAAPQDRVLAQGFDCPHSWRGRYAELAFAPAEHVTVASMLACARVALDGTFEGYKGGHFTMTGGAPVNLDFPGNSGGDSGLTRERLAAMLQTEGDAELALPRHTRPYTAALQFEFDGDPDLEDTSVQARSAAVYAAVRRAVAEDRLEDVLTLDALF